MKTKSTEHLPEIKWEQISLLDTDIDERSETWIMKGQDAGGREYAAIANYTCGELDKIEEIELIVHDNPIHVL